MVKMYENVDDAPLNVLSFNADHMDKKNHKLSHHKKQKEVAPIEKRHMSSWPDASDVREYAMNWPVHMSESMTKLADVHRETICQRFNNANRIAGMAPLDELRRATVLVGVVTNRNSHKGIARHNLFVKRMMAASSSMQNEGGHAISFMYFTNAELASGNFMSVGESGDEDSNRRTATLRAFLSIWYTAKNCLSLPNLQWFMILDDDAVIHPGRLNKFLYVVGKQLGSPTRTPIIIGRDAPWAHGEVFGGNGVLFSKAGLQQMYEGHGFRDAVKQWGDGYMKFLENMITAVATDSEVPMIHLAAPFGISQDICLQDEMEHQLIPYFNASTRKFDFERFHADMGPLANLALSLHKVFI